MIEQPLYPVAGLTGSDSRALCDTLALMHSVILHREINEGERLLWIWLVIHCAEAKSIWCFFTYQQLADVMIWKPDAIHRALHRLRLLGFLIADLPYLKGIVTLHDAVIERKLRPTLPEHEKFIKRQIEINLIRNQGNYRHANLDHR